MKSIRIILTADEDKVGSVIAAISGLCQITAFEVVEELPYHVNRPRTKSTSKKKKVRSRSPKTSAREFVLNLLHGTPLTGKTIRDAMVKAGYKRTSANSLLQDMKKKKEILMEGPPGGKKNTYTRV